LTQYFKALSAAAIFGSLAFANPASATVINGTCTSASGPTDLLAATTGAFNCTKFDSNLGALNSMVLTITGQITGTISITNTGPNTENFQATTTSMFTALALAGFGTPSFSASLGTGAVSQVSGSSVVYGPLAGNGTTGPMFNNSVLAPYEAAGGGFFDINVGTLTGLALLGGGGNLLAGQSTQANVTATVSYDYGVQTPEPATMAVLGAGMLGLGLARRRRNKA